MTSCEHEGSAKEQRLSSRVRKKSGEEKKMRYYSSFRCEVTWLMTRTGAGPMPRTVVEPAATCVRPLLEETRDQRQVALSRRNRAHASWIERAQIPSDLAVACRMSSSSSESHLTAILACLRGPMGVREISIERTRYQGPTLSAPNDGRPARRRWSATEATRISFHYSPQGST